VTGRDAIKCQSGKGLTGGDENAIKVNVWDIRNCVVDPTPLDFDMKIEGSRFGTIQPFIVYRPLGIAVTVPFLK
jgi:hypothetical protein